MGFKRNIKCANLSGSFIWRSFFILLLLAFFLFNLDMEKQVQKIFIYLDESSRIDLSSSKLRNNVFNFGGFYCLNEENCKNILNKATSKEIWIKTKQEGKEIKGKSLHLKIKKELITFKHAIGIVAFLKILDKKFFNSSDKNYFKFYMISYLINSIIVKLKYELRHPIQIHLYLDRNTEVEKEDTWKESLKSQIWKGLKSKIDYLTDEVKKLYTLDYEPDIFIESIDSKMDDNIQLADVIANTLYQTYNDLNLSWMDFCYTNFFNIKFIGDKPRVPKLMNFQKLIHNQLFEEFWNCIEYLDNKKE
ncbi:hypothetical protein MHJ_0389 [Mesomycoplasma hyopneumoniae J]|uniref:DUF3800 domain-containing protein n=2 Tax=Mesomycoplasma hyopneumoniae TaxID=2099 RepID=Q4A9U5_MESHJ|nr:hypothetical protein MHJ_0389 [Mesomycoplasma hyopneumoniae J]